MSKLYVGNLSWNTDDESLRTAFSNHGNVVKCIVMRDRETGRSRGFAFVEFSNDDEAAAAITQMNDFDLDGRRIRCNLANDRTPGGGGGGGRGRGDRYGGGDGYGGGRYGGDGYNSGGGRGRNY